MRSANCRAPSVNPRVYFEPPDMTETIAETAAVRVLAQRKWLESYLNMHMDEHVGRALKWGVHAQREARAREANLNKRRQASQQYGVWVDPTELARRDHADAHAKRERETHEGKCFATARKTSISSSATTVSTISDEQPPPPYFPEQDVPAVFTLFKTAGKGRRSDASEGTTIGGTASIQPDIHS